MRFIFLALVLVVALMGGVAFFRNKKDPVIHKTESSLVKFSVKDFPQHGISLIVPSDSSFSKLQPKLTKAESDSIHHSYSVFLDNASSRAVVGYSIKWECFGRGGEASERDVSKDRHVSHIVSWVFLHGEETDRKAAVKGSNEIIMPHSTWLISFDSPARPLESGDRVASATRVDESGRTETLEGCASAVVTADGIFFEDGTFIGPDTSGFFIEIKSQMDARYEILRGIQDGLRSGKKADEIFKGLEIIRDRERVELGERPTPGEFRSYFRSMFARDVLGKKEFWGADKAIQDVQLQLSKPWVNLRKL